MAVIKQSDILDYNFNALYQFEKICEENKKLSEAFNEIRPINKKIKCLNCGATKVIDTNCEYCE